MKLSSSDVVGDWLRSKGRKNSETQILKMNKQLLYELPKRAYHR